MVWRHFVFPNYFWLVQLYLSIGLRERGKNVLLPKPNTKYLLKRFKFSGARLWNNFPLYTKLQNSLASLKRDIPTLGS